MDVIQVADLRKSYGKTEVLCGISFQVRRGEIFGILGTNGAGKTTTLECMEGFRKYDGGRIQLKGSVGIQLQSASLPGCMKPLEAVELFARWKRTKPDGELIEGLGIREFSKKKYAELSTGQKRRLHLALALTGNPDILFLDEPAAGLDVEGRLALHERIRRLNRRGATIVLASHDMAEVEELCGRIAILNSGRIAFLGTAEELADRVDSRFVIRIRTEQGERTYRAAHIGEDLLRILESLKREKVEVLDVSVSWGTLEQHFMDLAKGA